MGHVKGLREQLGKLGRYKGEVVEGWLSAVECMLEIKERTDPDGKVHKEGVPKGLLTKEERRERRRERERVKRIPVYAPFVMRLGYLRDEDEVRLGSGGD